jgi:spermidine synthase
MPSMPLRSRSSLALYLVAACLLLSGTGSLVLEVVWSRLLKLVFGSTTLAISTILVAYMLGLGLGGLLGGRLAARLRNGVRAYGWFEVAIALYAFAVPWILELFLPLSRTVLAPLSFWPAALLRFGAVLLFFLLPTLMMGATLPVLVAAVARSRADLARRVGLLYGINTFGAVSGVLLASFVLFPLVGVFWSNAIGAGADLLVGLLAVFVLAPRLSTQPAPDEPAEEPPPAPVGERRRWNPVLVSYSAVGFTALGYEVCWTRALSMVTGSSIYAFTAMLAAFLAGIALGSLVARRWFDDLRRPLPLYAGGMALLGVLALGTMISFAWLPDAFLRVMEYVGVSGGTMVLASTLLSIGVMILPTLVLGALFPLVTRAAAASAGAEPSRVVADVYFVNTIGSAAGAFAAGFVFIPWIGLQRTMALGVALNLGLAAALLLWQREWTGRRRNAVAVVVAAAALVVAVAPPRWDELQMTRGGFYRPRAQMDFGLVPEPLEGIDNERILYYRDGLNTTVSVHRVRGGLSLRLGGKTDASLIDMSTQELSGHIPMLFGPPAERALVVGYASGVTAGAVTLHDIEKLDVVELEPAVLEGSRWFDPYNHRPLEDPRVQVHVADGRNFLQTTPERYDVIISEPSNPWISGCSNLFTREYFELVRERLRPGGRLLQWMQLYGMDPSSIRAVLRAVRTEFDHVYGFLYFADHVDFLMLASDRPLEPGALPRWDDIDPAVREDLRRVSVFSTADLWSLLRVTPAGIDAFLAEQTGPVNTDDNMYVELRAPWTMYEPAERNVAAINEHAGGVVALFDPAERAALGPELLAEIALSYLSQRQDPPLAARTMEAAQTLGPSAHGLLVQAEFLRRRGASPGEIRRLLDRAVELAPDAFLPRLYRGYGFLREGGFPGALEDARAALRARPLDYRAQRLRLRSLGALNRIPEARADAEALLARQLGPFLPQLYADAAPAAAMLGRLDEAIDELRTYLEHAPEAVAEWQLLARMYEDAGQPDAAATARANAARAARNQLIDRHRFALYEERFGSRERAIELLESVVEADPDYERARRDLERLRRAPGAEAASDDRARGGATDSDS